jgi:hypothetical protein
MYRESALLKMSMATAVAMSNNSSMIRKLPYLLSALGLLVLLVGFSSYCGTSLPFQDPTPEMLVRQQEEIDFDCMVMAGGFCVSCISTICLLYQRRKPPIKNDT